MIPLLVLILAYLIGGIPFGFILVKIRTGSDVRASGSGNIGATNVLRTAGWAIGIATLLLDLGKGYFAVWMAGHFTAGSVVWMSAAALAVMAGHAFPVLLKFRGGKAVASFIGAFLYLTPIPVLAVLVVFVLLVWVSKQISVGSIVAAGTFPFAVWLILHPEPAVELAALAAGAFIVYRHRPNIERILAGSENLFSFKRST